MTDTTTATAPSAKRSAGDRASRKVPVYIGIGLIIVLAP